MFLIVFCFPRTFFRSLSQAPVLVQALRPHATVHAARAAVRLVAGAADQRESARNSCSSGSGPPPWHSPCSGSSSNDVAKARCAATERMPLQRCTQAPRALTRRAAGADESCCFTRPAATYLDTEDDETALACPLTQGRCDGVFVRFSCCILVLHVFTFFYSHLFCFQSFHVLLF